MASVVYPSGFHTKDGFPHIGNQIKKEIVSCKNNLKAFCDCGRIISRGNIFDGTEAEE